MGTGGLSLPGVEKAMAEMEGAGAEDLKERFARLGRRVSGGRVAAFNLIFCVEREALQPVSGITARPDRADFG
jgi:hypothetical protein